MSPNEDVGNVVTSAMRGIRDKTQGVWNAPNISLLCANVACFIVCQCLFFYYVGSTQYDNMLQDKVRFIKGFLDESPVLGPVTCVRINDLLSKSRATAKAEMTTRLKKNRRLLMGESSWFIVPCILVAVVAGILAHRKGRWSSEHNWSLALIAGCFTTEIFIYFGLFRTHQVVGDYEIIKMIFESKFKE